ncbi:MAG: hypothetical protein PUD05_02970 [Lachnospiraceae bacterium]|nr:hypothetical protein [Lachnospiraceae bacterium]
MADRTEKHAGRDNNSEDDAASRLVPGLYEQVISHSLAGKLSGVPDAQKSVSKIDEGEIHWHHQPDVCDVTLKKRSEIL